MSKDKVNFTKLKNAIMTGQKSLVNNSGQVVHNVDDAALAIKPTFKVVQDNTGTFYLLRKDQDLNQIKRDNPQALPKLKLAYEQKKREFQAFKALMKENKSFIPFESGPKKRPFQEEGFNPLIDQPDDHHEGDDQTTNTTQTPVLRPMPKPTRVSLHEEDMPSKPRLTPTPSPTPSPIKRTAKDHTPSIKNRLVNQPMDIRFNLAFIHSVFGQALSPESLKVAPFIAFMTDLRMQGLIRTVETFGVDAEKPNVADTDFAKELRNGATYPRPSPYSIRPEPK